MSKPQPRLGRGLDSLIRTTTTPPDMQPVPQRTPQLMHISVRQVRPNPRQPRRDFDPETLGALADSIRNHGTLQPIIVRRLPDESFELVAGERRLRAARMAGLETIPAILRDADDDSLLELALIENLHREDLNPVDRARAYAALAARHNASCDEIANRVGEDRATVANYLRLLDLSDNILVFVRSGLLPMSHARCLLALADPRQRFELAERVIREGWSVRRLEQFVQSRADRAAGPASAPRVRPVIADLQARLTQTLGMKVQIRESRRKNCGRVIIEYHGLDDFDRLTALLGLQP